MESTHLVFVADVTVSHTYANVLAGSLGICNTVCYNLTGAGDAQINKRYLAT